MNRVRLTTRSPRGVSAGTLLALLLSAVGSPGQTPGGDYSRPVLSPRDLGIGDPAAASPAPASGGAPRVRLFRMPTAFLHDPLGLEDNDPILDDAPPAPAGKDDGRMQVAVGYDNPFFDIRSPGDPGGVGYYKLHTQLQLLDSRTTFLTLGLQAVTPAGLEADGLQEGPTILSPSLSWFHEVGDGTAVQGFVGKNVRAGAGWTDRPERGLKYGLAVQSPVPVAQGTPSRRLHVFLEALGRYRPDGELLTRAANWELVPGVHWRLSDSWWMSGGVLVPLGVTKPDKLWQITCSWQF